MRVAAALALTCLSGCPSAPEAPSAGVVECRPTAVAKRSAPDTMPMAFNTEMWCLDAPSEGRYHMALTVKNPNEEAVLLERVVLEKLSPRPVTKPWVEKIGALETSVEVKGLPATLAKDASVVLDIGGRYVMDADEYDQSKRVNMHLLVEGKGADSGKPVELTLTAHLLGADSPETMPGHGGNGPPATRQGTEPLEAPDGDREQKHRRGKGPPALRD